VRDNPKQRVDDYNRKLLNLLSPVERRVKFRPGYESMKAGRSSVGVHSTGGGVHERNDQPVLKRKGS
jgi:hypothetical protein